MDDGLRVDDHVDVVVARAVQVVRLDHLQRHVVGQQVDIESKRSSAVYRILAGSAESRRFQHGLGRKEFIVF